jgi:RND family efflux transporter MFP subunit
MRPGAVSLFALSLVIGCGRSSADPGLPPATGSGVPAPEIPSVGALLQAAPAAGSERGALSITGTLYAREEASLGPSASGTLREVKVREGDRVKKGQLLFRLDAAQAGLAVDQARAQLESARVNERAMELEFNRTKELFDRGSIPKATFEQVQARRDLAKASVAQSQAQLALLQKNAADNVVRSPIDGVVTQKLKNVGETVTMMPPTIVVVVQDIDQLELRARMPERTLATVKAGTPLRVRFPSVNVERVVPVARINPAVDVATRTVELVAWIDNKDGALRPGMLADVSIDAPATGAGGAGGSPATAGAPGRAGSGGATRGP